MEIGIIEAVAVVIEAGIRVVGIDFLAGKTIQIGAGVGSTRRNRVAKGIVAVAGGHVRRRGVVDQHRHVAVSVGVIEIVPGPTAG